MDVDDPDYAFNLQQENEILKYVCFFSLQFSLAWLSSNVKHDENDGIKFNG